MRTRLSKVIQYFLSGVDSKYPFTLMDVGAMGGIPRKWKPLLNHMKVIAFEPDTREFSKLKNSDNITYFNLALSSEPRELMYYIAKEPGKSSIYRPNTEVLRQYADIDRFEIIKEERIPPSRVSTLDMIMDANAVRDIDFIKLDTQGSELPILRGGEKRALKNIFGVQVETEFIEMYKGQPLFKDIDLFMNNSGFSIIDLRRNYWKRNCYYSYKGRGQLVFCDALYFKNTENFFKELSLSADASFCRSKIHKSILTCLLYGMFDYAVQLAESAKDFKQLSAGECAEAVLNIKKYTAMVTDPRLRLNGKLYTAAYLILRKFKPMSFRGWADSDYEIGNIRDL